MQSQYTPSAAVPTPARDPLLDPVRRHLSRPQWQNLLALILAVQLGRTLILRQLSLYLLLGIESASCYRRLERCLAWGQHHSWKPLQRAWVRAVIRTFAPGRGWLPLIIDWTWHQARCRSLWVMLAVGGRAVPLCFWLAPPETGGKGTQRALEDQALCDLAEWLPKGRPVVLLGDRGFRGRERMRLLERLEWHFVLRLTAETQVCWEGEWRPLAALRPGVGQRWQRAGLQVGKPGRGKGQSARSVTVQVVAVRQALPAPKPQRTAKGNRSRKTGTVSEETTWFLATNLPLTFDAVALYAWRMQIEQTFRDFKALYGMEEERTRCPWERLPVLLWALLIGMTLVLRAGGPGPSVPPLPRGLPREASGDLVPVPAPERGPYPSESRTRVGLHAFLLQLVLGQSPLTGELQALARKSERLRDRPQVRERRRETPALRCRTRRASCSLYA